MRNFRILAAAMMLAAIFAVSVSAQTRPAAGTARPAAPQQTTPPAQTGPVPDTKIAYINTEAFGDEKVGITRYVTAIKALEREFQPRQTELEGLNTRLKTLAADIQKMSGSTVVDPKSLQSKQEEAEGIQRDMKYKKEQADALFAKRYEEAITPISQDIGKALSQFATQRGITMILDISKLAPAVLTANPAMDVTQAFISEYNSKPTTASAGGTR
jgi:Skp family chaperone for outer membrane proteins